jgi:hypothetical protein
MDRENYRGEETMKEIDINENVTLPSGKLLDKVTRYGWTVKDVPGTFMEIPKGDLVIDHSYQRTPLIQKVRSIQSSWSWVAFCCIPVAFRSGRYYVIDGWHRVLAAMSRSEISTLPCMVFNSSSVEDEAKGFLNINSLRRPLASIAGFKAQLTAGDEHALYIDKILRYNNIILTKHASAPRQLSSVAACIRMAKEDKIHFEKVISIASELCNDCFVQSTLIEGLFYLSKHIETDLTDPRLRKRILAAGSKKLVQAANKSVAYHNAGGARIYAIGMVDLINSNLSPKNKFKLIEVGE